MQTKKQIRDVLEKRFSSLELRELVEMLGFHYTEFESGNLKNEIFEIVNFFEQRLMLDGLWNKMAQMRPDILSELPEEVVLRAIDEYLQKLSAAPLYVDITGYVPNFPRIKVDFSSVSVELFVTQPAHFIQIGASANAGAAEKKVIGFNELLDQLPSHWLLLGGMAFGKTFWLRRMEQEMAGRTSAGQSNYVPFYIDLSSPSILGYSANLQPEAVFDHIISKALGLTITLAHLLSLRNEVVFLFDEFDKLPDNYRRSFSLMFEKLDPGCKIIVACRSGEYAPQLFDAALFYVSQMDLLSKDAICNLATRLYQSVLASTNSTFVLSLEDIKEMLLCDDLETWIKTPLEVLVLVLTYAVNLSLDRDSIKTIFKQRCIALQISEWDLIRPQSQRGDKVMRWKDVAEALSYMAFYSYDHGLDDLAVPIEAGAKRLVDLEIFQTPEKARRELIEGLTTVQRNSYILQPSTRTYATNFKYQNPNIVEILAAEHLLNIPKEARERIVGSKIIEKVWKNALLSLFDLLISGSQQDAEEFLGFVLSKVDDHKQLKAEDARIALFASVCIERGRFNAHSHSDKARNLILKILSDEEQSVPLQTRIALAEYLGALGDPRIGKIKLIPGGYFWRGFDPYPNDRPVEKIFISEFEMDVYPVTNHQFRAFIEDRGYTRPELWDPEGWKWVMEVRRTQPGYWDDEHFNRPNYPVVGVSWFEADAYARWSGQRLPTEAEWEKAARGENALEWPWGNSFRGDCLNCSDSEELIHGTTPIGVYPAGQSPYGIFDLAGNVSEWVSDWYKPYERNLAKDSHYGESFKIRRGGGWAWDRDFVRCTCRNASPRVADYAVLGFRCVK